MREMGIEAVYPRPNTSKPNPEHKIYPYLLKNLDITRPNQVWSIYGGGRLITFLSNVFGGVSSLKQPSNRASPKKGTATTPPIKWEFLGSPLERMFQIAARSILQMAMIAFLWPL